MMNEQNLFSQPNELLEKCRKAALVDRDLYDYNPILGYVRKTTIQQALEQGAIVFRDDAWFVAVEQKTVGVDNEGKPLRFPKKIKVVSKRYYEFMERLNGTKINRTN